MNLTYVLGNGMDLQLGLPTSFFDFYKWAEKNNKENMFLPHTYEEKNIDDWADYETVLINIFNDYLILYSEYDKELNFPKYLDIYTEQLDKHKNETLSKDKVEFFSFLVDQVDNVSTVLEEYLLVIDNKVKNIKDVEATFVKIKERLLYIDKFFQANTRQRDRIDAYISKFNSMQRRINIITLNYTCTSEMLYYAFKSSEDVIINKKPLIFHNANKLLYLHGRLTSPQWSEGITIGVHSTDEIDENYRDLEDAKYLAKSVKMSDIIGSKVYKNATEILSDNGNIIICYGVSFGKSDKALLAAVVNKARKNKALIIFYEYVQKNNGNTLPRTVRHLKKRILNKIYSSFSDLTDEEKENINNNLIAIPIDDNKNLIPNELRLFDYTPENNQNKEPII
ncbi:bacteriophage abortive infection AbiH family protein [Mammaliicoccus sciuri]|uniref:bacteriophage abortive infection AbiH family protein n=1 Tax=Mammaliicoccus sciuri TaxID=1296 RepID=UPI0021D14929|nr:bacteriophage abortive infection AbiH family protein [Mammaliicoccus sciuri]UXU70207.1 bacteriophage abortive infection AbiH family protein [Mammaliicoccus sciuri]